MGGKRKYNKFAQRKRDKKELAKNPPKYDERKCYAEIVRENKEFEIYYKEQNICPPEEWDEFMKTIKENLPTAFRITGSKGEAKALLDIVKGQLFNDILNSKKLELLQAEKPAEEKEKANGANGDSLISETVDEELQKPICLPWYPGGLAWQLQLTRSDIRRSEAYYRLHNFLTAETSSGSISRQESVSMIPPIVLDVQPHHKVLDMCASPGSKTAQLIEFLHSNDNGSIPTGFVMANDVDNNRCYMLVHQAKRLNSPCILITNHDAAFMPNLTIGDGWDAKNADPSKLSSENMKSKLLKFDRILCDVPCSGDGTLRKNADIWLKWSPGNGNNLHGVQYRIGHRGAELLTVGGRLAYSTCSLNPLECEAVILRLLREAKGCLKLVEISDMLPGLKFSRGKNHWRPASKDMVFYDKFEDVPEKWTTCVRPQMFPPTPEEIEEYHLERCIRILPHHQDTGGFFVAVLEKVSVLPFEKKEHPTAAAVPSEAVDDAAVEGTDKPADVSNDPRQDSISAPWGPQRKKRRMGGYKEDPYVFFSGDTVDVYPSIRDFYSLRKDFDAKCLLTRCLVGKKKNIYSVSPLVRDVVMRNEDKVKIINTGVKTFVRCDNNKMPCAFRLSQEGLPSVMPYIGEKRIVKLPKSDLVMLLLNDNPHTPPDIDVLTDITKEQVKDLEHGSCVLVYEEGDLSLKMVGWRGVRSLRAYTALPDTVHMLRLLGEDTSKFDVNKFKKVTDNQNKAEKEDPIPEKESVKDDVMEVEEKSESETKATDNTATVT